MNVIEDRDGNGWSTCWLTSQMPATGGPGKGCSQDPETESSSHTRVAGTQFLEPSPPLKGRFGRGAGSPREDEAIPNSVFAA